MTEPTRANRPGDTQPMPLPGVGDPIHALVVRDLQARLELGIERYGQPLQAHNGRNALQDAYDEALDLACYLRQAIEEQKSPMPARIVDRDGDGWTAQPDGRYSFDRKPGSSRSLAFIEEHYGPVTRGA